MNTDSSPIAAIATAPGRGGVGIIRISGKNLEPFISEFFKAATTELPLKPRYAYFLPFLDENSNIIDEGIALYFKGPIHLQEKTCWNSRDMEDRLFCKCF